MKAYYYDNLPGDQRLPHDAAPSRPVPESYLASLGVLYHHCTSMPQLDAIASQRSYRNRDTIVVSAAAMGAVYEDKVRMFFHEHLHEDEEIRYVLDGYGYFDVRSEGDEWVRIRLEKDDLIVLPAGIYHRFTTDQENYIKAMRLFQDEPKWTPLNRGDDTDVNVHRKGYLQGREAKAKAEGDAMPPNGMT